MPKRDADLIIIVALFVLGGLISIASPFILQSLASSRGIDISLSPLSLSVSILSGLLALITAYGLWNFQKWGWFLAMGVLVLGVIRSIISGSYLAAVIPILILIYLFQKRHKFGGSSTEI